MTLNTSDTWITIPGQFTDFFIQQDLFVQDTTGEYDSVSLLYKVSLQRLKNLKSTDDKGASRLTNFDLVRASEISIICTKEVVTTLI